MNPIHTSLSEYYSSQGIHPLRFSCKYQAFCRKFAHQGQMTETKMSMLGSRYGENYPRIVVLSLDPPLGGQGAFVLPEQRTTAYVTAYEESLDITKERTNVHWAMTQIIVKDLLSLFGYPPSPGSAVVVESYAGRPIENVSAYFAHINMAKCSMNHPDKGQANYRVHETCGRAYLHQELEILQPDILISQGQAANRAFGKLIGKRGAEKGLPKAFQIQLRAGPVLWLPMDHPARRIAQIRSSWPFYLQAVKNLKR
jgi:hypothetical protein